MQATYTALREINTEITPYWVYDFDSAAGHFSAPAVLNRNQPFSVDIKFNFDDVYATYAQVYQITNAVTLYVHQDGYLRVYVNADTTGYDHTNLEVTFGREQSVTLEWDAAGNYSVTKDGVTEGNTVTTYTSATCAFRWGDHSGTYPVNGFIYDGVLTVSGSVEATWGGHDGSGTTIADATNSNDLNLTGVGSPAPAGWLQYTPTHYVGEIYTIPVVLMDLDTERKTVKSVARSLSGETQHTVHRTDVFTTCKTIPLSGEDARNFREFLASVENGENFFFDDGNGDVLVELEGGFTEKRTVKRGDGGASDCFTFSWKHRAA